MEKLTIGFTSFYNGYDNKDNFADHITEVLSQRYDTRIVSAGSNPDILFFSCFHLGNPNHLRYDAKLRIYFTGENDVPDFNLCDSAISFHHIDFGDRHLRMPLYCLVDRCYENIRDGHYHRGEPPKPATRPFCSAVISNVSACDPYRIDIFNALDRYKKIKSGGRWNNNTGGPVQEKWDFIGNYKFHLSLENSSIRGYVTEKILDAFYCRTVPIYWGAPDVSIDFNPRSFININDFPTLSEAMDYIAKVDSDDALYQSYLDENPLKGSPFVNKEKMLLDFISRSLENRQSAQRCYAEAYRHYTDAAIALEINRRPTLHKVLKKIIPIPRRPDRPC